ncbi:MAG: NAD(P)(+) transhydrogenase (Re/Si-specific) subunit beta [Candidatus Nanopelagicales bacterium]|nr:NAD(P)(+) transhydrogenase (Re/Si-specific) subunit beta [Candidatus Nanopelagicales bacterium]MDP4975405.1 NAD(P)(+) transhydrogenase (Re/Si-specific) subunit beta [Candidatus Nanopelagicales bacterium]MDP5094948.1 NAD(P)(+) transhydrogenase (Re/Si-specific) subunit beta [Candidatus Nanopelagicales bacterium]
MNTPTWAQLVNLAVAVLFILSLKGLSSPKTARLGTGLGALGALIATVVLFFTGIELNNFALIIGAILAGSLVGWFSARRVKMTAMPQLVALFNGVGGGAAGLVAVVEYLHLGGEGSALFSLFTVVTIIIGSVAFSGSIVTYLKLQEIMTTRPVVLPAGKWITILVALGTIASAVWLFVDPQMWVVLLLSVLALAFGVLFVLPVGGADVPIVISLLNACTGLAVAASGYVLDNVLLLIAGTLVGASGTLLTSLMAKAMGRPLTSTLFGAFSGTTQGGSATGEERPVRSGGPGDIAIMLGYANKVILVPGYGLAVAQAQSTLRELADLLTARGIEVDYAIHPVAGRMPGHMNVLLAEASVPYEQLKEMEEINPEFSSTDVVLVVGANDVVNPAARTDKSAPIYGMPILDVDQAQQVVFLKRSMRPGFAGIENELLYDPKTTMLFGDAKDSLTKVVSSLKTM